MPTKMLTKSRDEAQRKMRDLAAKAVAVAEDEKQSPASRRKQIEAMDVDIKAFEAEAASWDAVESNRRRMGADWMGGDQTEGVMSDVVMSGKGWGQVNAAPRLALTNDQASGLFDALKSKSTKRFDVDLKLTGSGQVPVATFPQRILPPTPVHREPTRILDLIPVRPVSSPIVTYYVQLAKAQAAVVAEGAVKPLSDVSTPGFSAQVEKIVAAVPVTDEVLRDFPAFLSFVYADLQDAVVDLENAELLASTGTAPRFIVGMLNTTGILTRAYNSAAGGDDNPLDALARGARDLRVGAAKTDLTGWVMSPNTYWRLRITKDLQGRYLLGDPVEGEVPNIWGKPVVQTTQIADGTVLGGNFAEAAKGFIRDSITIEASNSLAVTSTDNVATTGFLANVTGVIAEERVGMYVDRPTALVKITGVPSV